MKEIILDNFLKMNPQAPEYSQKNTNYLISGADPLYYLNDNSQEEQVAPLSASIDWKQITATIQGNIVHMVSGVGGTYTAYAITDTTKVYGITTSSVVDLGYPTGSSVGNIAGYLVIGGNSLYATFGSAGTVYYMPLSSGAWSSFGSINSAVGTHFMEQFADHIAIADGTVAYTQANLVKLIDPTTGTPTILTTPLLNVGLGFGILQMRNFNDKYLAVAVGKVGSGGGEVGYPQNYIYLWDGALDTFNYSVKVPGKFIDMKVVNSTLYVAVQVSNGKTCIYYLSGTQLKKVFTTQISTINTSPGQHRPATFCVLFDFKNYLGVKLSNTPDLTVPILVYGKDEVGGLEFIYSSGRIFDQFVVDYNGVLFANEYVSGGNSNLYYLPTTGTYQTILYRSQWIPVNNLQSLDIFYNSLPVSGTDAINVTIYGRGEDIITGTSTTVLDSITPTNYLNAERTRLDCKGFTGDKVKIELSTVNSTWKPNIRKIKLITA